MPFVRVRSAGENDPLHEFDVTAREAEAHPDLYVVIDPEPVSQSRPALFISGVAPVKDSAPAIRRRAKTPGENSTAPAGADS